MTKRSKSAKATAGSVAPFPIAEAVKAALVQNCRMRLVMGDNTDPRPLARIAVPDGPTYLLTELHPADLRVGYGLEDQGDGNMSVGRIDLAAVAARGGVLDADFAPDRVLSLYVSEAVRRGRS